MNKRPISSRDSSYRIGQLSLFPQRMDNGITLRLAANNAESLLASGIGPTAQYLVLEDGARFPLAGVIRIGEELVYYRSKVGDRLTGLVRGWSGSPIGRHNRGVAVKAVIDADHHNALRDAILKIQAKAGLQTDDEELTTATGRLRLYERKWGNPEANFRSSVRSGYGPLTATFQDISRGFPSVRRWSFGDGTGTVTGAVVTHTFHDPGEYDITLEVVNDRAGYSRRTKKAYIKVLSDTTVSRVSFSARNPEPVSFFRASNRIEGFSVESELRAILSLILSIPSAETQGQVAYLLGQSEVTFDALVQTVDNYSAQALLDAVSFTEDEELIKRVADLSIYLEAPEDEGDDTRFDELIGPDLLPIDPVTGRRTVVDGEEVEFFDQSKGRIAERTWDFGDGNIEKTDEAGWKVRYTYPGPGIYQPSLTITGFDGKISTAQMNTEIEVKRA